MSFVADVLDGQGSLKLITLSGAPHFRRQHRSRRGGKMPWRNNWHDEFSEIRSSGGLFVYKHTALNSTWGWRSKNQRSGTTALALRGGCNLFRHWKQREGGLVLPQITCSVVSVPIGWRMPGIRIAAVPRGSAWLPIPGSVQPLSEAFRIPHRKKSCKEQAPSYVTFTFINFF